MSNNRIDKILKSCIRTFDLNLRNLVVLTEAATGPYLYTPIMAALANAHKVYAITSDSRFGTKEKVEYETSKAADYWSVSDRINVIFNKDKDCLRKCDIITNTGFVRPINREMIFWMKETAVIPLMWEPWEFRSGEIDLEACRAHGILVMGTDEQKHPLDMYSYAGFFAMKMLYELGLEGCKIKVLLLGGKESLGESIYRHFTNVGIDVAWFTLDSEGQSRSYSDLKKFFINYGADFDVIILSEHAHNICLLGQTGLISYEDIQEINPALCIGVIAGNVDVDGLKRSGLSFFPREILPFGYMSYQSYHLGPLPVLELYAAGLKVGQEMANGRLMGMSVEETKHYALKNSPAMDF